MKKFFIHKLVLCSLAAAALSTSCANSDDLDVPPIHYYKEEPTKTIDELYAMADASLKQFTEDDIIEAYVSSSDQGGTFYKTVTLQNAAGTKGFSISVDMYNIYTEAEPGRKVYVHLKDLYYTIANGALVIGDKFEESVGRMRPQLFKEKVLLSAEKVNEEDMVKKVTIAQLKSDNYINILVQVDQAQFTTPAIGKPYYDPTNVLGGATNYLMQDATGTVIFRTSEFAKFAKEIVPSKSGSIRGVMTKFNTDYQFMARTYEDIQLAQDYQHTVTAKGGTQLTFQNTVNVTFEGYNPDQDSFPELINDYTVGSRYWQIKAFGANKYVQMSSFGGGGVTANTYLMVPVAFNGASTVSFETKDGYYTGDVLKVYYVMADQYTFGQLIDASTFTEITSHFTISTGHANGYGPSFVPSGNYTLPAQVSGNGYLVFEYAGNATKTTTMQIDNIKVN